MTTPLTQEQSAAHGAIKDFLLSDKQFFVLSGSAGTGKTYLIRALADTAKGRFIFTAPTNKATKVLRDSVTTKDYKPECRTIYSLLGLRLEPSGEVKTLVAPDDPIDLSKYQAVIVDEGSMVSENLRKHIKFAADAFKVKFIFLGDPAQLPPVGEPRSPIWRITDTVALTKVMRHDNQILALATRLRGVVDKLSPTIQITSDHTLDEGVWKLSAIDFDRRIAEEVQLGNFSKPSHTKVIAWRNSCVDKMNVFVRRNLFGAAAPQWLPTDRVIFTAPATDMDDEVIATTDDEGTIDRIAESRHPTFQEFKIYQLAITMDDGTAIFARVLHPDSFYLYAQRVNDLSAAAKANPRKWKEFWCFKEAFHQLRHSYAITAHRAQGSTYDTAFVCWQDILANQARNEAFRCLYVACSRPKRRLFLG